MENIDVILLTIAVVASFVVFIVTSLKEFNRMEEEPYEYEKATGPTRAALFNALSDLFEENETPQKDKEKLKRTITRTISDMHSDGVHFDSSANEPPKKTRGKKKSSKKKKKNS
jgi:hypothetical protein